MSSIAPVTVLPCPTCKGTTIITSQWRADRACTTCVDGTVTIDVQAIREVLTVTRGKSKGSFRRSRPAGVLEAPKPFVYGAAYCWRIVRWHAGQDLTMPVMAADYVGVGWVVKDESKAVIDVLEEIAFMLAVEFFGRGALIGTGRWGKALYGDTTVLDTAGVDPMDPAYWGNGSDVRGIEDSPEAALEEATDFDGNVDLDSLSGQLASANA